MLWDWINKRSAKSARHLELGEQGEELAAKFLKRRGYKILVRHYRAHAGEIDIVCRDGQWLVFVEVKTRTSERAGAPSEAVTPEKQLHITKVALDYLKKLGYPQQIRFRFDIVEVILPAADAKPADIRLIQNAFDLSEPFIY
jgi:putative endonuclease